MSNGLDAPELLAPAGNFEKMKIALAYGADAVYMGGRLYSLRAFSDNFTDAEMEAAVSYAHLRGKKVYVTVNIFPHNADLSDLPAYLSFLAAIKADGILVSDPGIFQLARRIVPDLPLHISTQANNVNWAAVQFWQDLGAKRVVLARELSCTEIADIRRHTDVELEAFVHGAMCISYSGRCLLSHYLTGRDANKGECAQPCRWRYRLVEEKRPGEYFPITEDERGAYIFNSKDLCLLPYLPALIRAGVCSLKIEGRMKSMHYVATVTRVYRQAIDAFMAHPDTYTVCAAWREELEKVSHRPYSAGFFLHSPGREDQIYTSSSYIRTHDFVGIVRDYDQSTQTALIEQRNPLRVGEEIEVLTPQQVFKQKIISLQDVASGEQITVAPHAQQLVRIPFVQPVTTSALLRRRKGDA